MPFTDFHPAVASWFAKRFGAATEPQVRAWPEIRAGRHTLIAAPTGSGKTLAAFLSAIDDLVRQSVLAGGLPDETGVVYVSPLKALSNDVEKNLWEPLAGIREELAAMGLPDVEIRTQVRTGDTPASVRTAMVKRPPHILVTTPESLFILLTSDGGRRMLKTVRTVIVDEIHAVADDKRGSHLALSLERLEALAGEGLLRIGLSATQRPIEEVARFLVGAGNVAPDGSPRCTIVDAGHGRRLDLAVEVPSSSPLEAVMSNEVWGEIYDRLAELVREHRTTLIFANTRRLAERATRHLSERLGPERVASHHGSLSKEQRLESERRLKAGELSALVATASLELGIDIGSVDLVCQLGSTRSIATLLQRVGRSGHHLGGLPKGRLFPLTRDELVECAALVDAVRRGELDHLIIPERPLDILAQHIVAAAAAAEPEEGWREDDLYALVRRAWPFRDLTRHDFDAVVEMLSTGFTTRRGRRGAYLHRDAVNGVIRARKGARLTAMTSGGAIPDLADYQVVLQPAGTTIGTVHEDFAVESLAGDVFQLGNASWRVIKVEQGRMLVEDAKGQPPNIPFWLGEAPARTEELSVAVSRLREEVAARVRDGSRSDSRAEAVEWLEGEIGLPPAAAAQIVDYLAASLAALGTMPTRDTLVAERFFDEAGDMHLVVHAPFGSRLNRAWGLALRKRFCQTFNFELQAAATEDAIVLSLGPTHSFPLEDAFRFLHSNTVRGVLTQAVLDAPLFGVRWRWNAGRALAIPRQRGGKRVPAPLLRQQAEDLVAVVFPDQLACLENIVGEREVPDHPLVEQTLRDCLEEAMDVQGLEALLRRIEAGAVELVARDVVEPSPLAHEILKAQPYAFLDDAPLEERRTQAVSLRRWLDPETASDLGALDADAIARVRVEAWPEAETPDELHDALLTLGFVTVEEGVRSGWGGLFDALAAARRATIAVLMDGPRVWVAAERLPQLQTIHPGVSLEPEIAAPSRLARDWPQEEALVEVVRGRLEGLGPITGDVLAASLGVRRSAIESALASLETEGFAFRGRFTPGRGEEEWCERRLLARIHRYTLDRLRREIEPVSQADYLRFLLAWQRADPDARAEGPESLNALLEQLEGFEAAAAAWEGEILPGRMKEYDPSWLDALCLSGRWVWGRATAPAPNGGARRSGPVRATPLALLSRGNLHLWREVAGPIDPAELDLSGGARSVYELLRTRGASFFGEIAHGAGLLHTQLEIALGELVAWGLVTSDSFTGLRALLVPAHKRPPVDRRRGSSSISLFGMENAGRWSLLHPAMLSAPEAPSRDAVEAVAWTLLRRYGVVFRRLLERETLLPPWRDLLMVFRRLEARGEIRGGRFVDGFSGEQYALTEAVGSLRALRKQPKKGVLVSVSAADPLNLVGIATPGDRLPALAGNRLLYRDGEPIAILEGREPRFLVDLDPAARWQAQSALVRRSVAPKLKAYLGRSA
ncbi:MAG: ATP-dependent helicase Lhr and Lhr-like helicase [Acidobacteriota bacterium]|jgi:ATP-dependent Lhr-like helicase|nr:ATP-dependent helicase Lhr and Lhr-like helicase [Acidobacteriota bacterium]